jgi:DNA segregation ATPase FtsK/SpoIIIE-like protein
MMESKHPKVTFTRTEACTIGRYLGLTNQDVDSALALDRISGIERVGRNDYDIPTQQFFEWLKSSLGDKGLARVYKEAMISEDIEKFRLLLDMKVDIIGMYPDCAQWAFDNNRVSVMQFLVDLGAAVTKNRPIDSKCPPSSGSNQRDELFSEACDIVQQSGRASTSYLQRRLKIGYNRVARVMEELEDAAIVSAPDHAGNRRVL